MGSGQNDFFFFSDPRGQANLQDAQFLHGAKFVTVPGRLAGLPARCDLRAKELRRGPQSILFLGPARGEPLRASGRSLFLPSYPGRKSYMSTGASFVSSFFRQQRGERAGAPRGRATRAPRFSTRPSYSFPGRALARSDKLLVKQRPADLSLRDAPAQAVIAMQHVGPARRNRRCLWASQLGPIAP